MSKTLEINASEKSLFDIFISNLYIIPVYQRPYSWDIVRCEKLLEDLNEQILLNSSSYFLGTIITTSEIESNLDDKLSKKDTKCSVIDGQQRLTTLLLLIRALYKSDIRNNDLKDCLYSSDSRDKTKLISTRVISHVNDDSESKHFMSLFDETEYSKNITKNTSFKDKHYKDNYEWFLKKIDTLTEKDVEKLSDFVLSTVTLLKVSVPKREDALIIFKTINDRGMQLDESDILKADIYRAANKKNEGLAFIEAWDNLYKRISVLELSIKDFDMPFLFRYYMHIKRGVSTETSKEISLLDFFQGKSINPNNTNKVNNLASIPWDETIKDLDKLCGALEWLTEHGSNGNIGYLYNVLRCYNNLYPQYAIITYLFHRVSKNDDRWYLDNKSKKDFVDFFEKIIAFSYTIVFLKPGVNSIKEIIFKMIVAVSNTDTEFNISNYTKYSKDDFTKLKSYLENKMQLKIARGYLMLLVYLNVKTDKKTNIPNVKILNIEHILPKNWDNNWHDNWDIEKVEDVMDKLGNLVLMDRATNIKASNLWFSKKKEKYEDSKFKHGEIQDLLDIKSNTWTYEQFETRKESTTNVLMHFFRDKQK